MKQANIPGLPKVTSARPLVGKSCPRECQAGELARRSSSGRFDFLFETSPRPVSWRARDFVGAFFTLGDRASGLLENRLSLRSILSDLPKEAHAGYALLQNWVHIEWLDRYFSGRS